MNLPTKPYALAALSALLFCHAALAETEGQVRERLKQEILTELLNSDALKQKIADGIKDYEQRRIVQNLEQQRLKPADDLTQRIKKQLRPVAAERDRIYGNADAPVSIVEFSDFECPYCRKIQPVLKRLVNESEGRLNWVLRHFPIGSHKPNALQEAEASECAGQLAGIKGFWRFSEALFQQPRRGQEDREPMIDRAAESAAIDRGALRECVQSGKFKDKIQADEDEALAIGLQGTPANILLHHKTGRVALRQGAVELETLKNDIAQISADNP